MTFFDLDAWRQALVQATGELGSTLAAFAPKLAGALLLLGAGWGIARLGEALTARMLRRVGLDRVGARGRAGEMLGHAGIAVPPSQLLAQLVFWGVLVGFGLFAANLLGMAVVSATLDRLLGFLPALFSASLLLLLGVLAGRLVRSVVGSAAAAAGLAEALRLGVAAQVAVVGLVAVLALEQLGVETELLVTLLSVVAAAVGLCVGLSIALGARPVITHILAGHFLRQRLARGGRVEVDGRRGVIERVGAVDTLLREGEQSVSIPNARLLEAVVTR